MKKKQQNKNERNTHNREKKLFFVVFVQLRLIFECMRVLLINIFIARMVQNRKPTSFDIICMIFCCFHFAYAQM